MVYKKYHKRGGKTFGPYYYESYRHEGKVKKFYIGGEKEYKLWLKRKKQEKKIKKSVEQQEQQQKKQPGQGLEQLSRQPIKINSKKKTFQKNKHSRLLVFIIIFAGLFGLLFFAVNSNLVGNVISNIEDVEQEFSTETADLQIKLPTEIAGEEITKNKNKRMDFEVEGGNIRLYFDLLNYSDFVQGVEEVILEEQTGLNDSVISITGNFIKRLTGFVIGDVSEIGEEDVEESEEVVVEENEIEDNDTIIDIDNNLSEGELNDNITEVVGEEVVSEEEIEEVTIEDVKDKIEELEEQELEDIEDSSVIEAEEFNIEVETPEDGDYKWGYKVRLNDLNFMAKVDVTSEKVIEIYNDNTLKIGNNLLSFADLVEQGYSIRMERPALDLEMIDVEEIEVEDVNITEVEEESEEVGDIVEEKEKKEKEKKEKKDKDEINVTEVVDVKEIEEELNITEEEVEEPVVEVGECYDNETEILTENGWKLFSDLEDDEKVMT
ncbi:hypothetical protein GOV12_06830, partial [Candidatus Pacearchaeota archaeon]|nr:hypothetical protein [Candidatus Pacearchaeota archaeon]